MTSRRPQTLEDYAYERLNQLHHFGAIVERPGTIYIGGWRVVVQALLVFGRHQQAHLWLYEVVEITEDGTPTRRKYQYHFQYDGGFAFRYDRDATQHPEMPEHKHLGEEGRRVPWGRVTLQDVVDEVTAIVADREAEEPPSL